MNGSSTMRAESGSRTARSAAWFLAVLFVLGLGACGGGASVNNGGSNDTPPSSGTTPPPDGEPVSQPPQTPPPPSPPPQTSESNTIWITDTSGAFQTNRAVSVARPFRQGDIAQFAQAVVNGTPVLTQTDAKNRWPDGSLKFAIVSFIVPALPANGTVTVSFVNQASGNNTGHLSQADMLNAAYDFDATIQMSGTTTQTVSARQMLQNGHFRYWLQGPIVTAVIIEDRTAARTYDKDFGDGSKALHPIFEAWFYPQGNRVDLGYTIENAWASTTATKSMRDLSYSLVLRSGHSAPVTEYSQGSFTHIGRTRWHKRYWLGADPASIHVDHNIKYLVSTKAIPNYDTGIRVAESLIASYYSAWTNANKTVGGSSSGIGNYSKSLASGGSHPWIGLMNTWDTLYLLTMDERMRQVSQGNADLAGRLPWHFREADSLAGSGDFFDAPTSGSVDTFGRPVSVNARRTVTLSELSMNPSDCGSQYASDKINTGSISDDGWDFYNLGRHHMPDLAYVPYLMSGRYYYLEQLQMQAAYIVAWKSGCYFESWQRQGEAGYFNDGEVRGEAWSYRTLTYAAFISPDGSPEKAYFEDKLLNNIARDEGKRDLPNSVAAKLSHWNWGRSRQMPGIGPSPLGLWDIGNSGQVSSPVKTDGSVAQATSPWMEHFVLAALGTARDMGYPTENLLKFTAKHMFGQLLNPNTSPYLIEGYRFATVIAGTNDWIRSWSNVNQYHNHSIPSGWRVGDDVDHGYGYIALGSLSFLYPYTVDGYTGQQAWNFLKANKPGQDRFATESPKWAILPRP